MILLISLPSDGRSHDTEAGSRSRILWEIRFTSMTQELLITLVGVVGLMPHIEYVGHRYAFYRFSIHHKTRRSTVITRY